jgi:hypothetical protein
MAEKKWKPKIHPEKDFGKFPWHKVGFEGMGPVSLNVQYHPPAANQPRSVDYPREAFIQFFLDKPWIEMNHGGAFRPYEIWIVPDGLYHMMDLADQLAKNDLRRSIKDLLQIRER